MHGCLWQDSLLYLTRSCYSFKITDVNSNSENYANFENNVDAENSNVAEIQEDAKIDGSTENYRSILEYFADKKFSTDTLQQLLP